MRKFFLASAALFLMVTPMAGIAKAPVAAASAASTQASQTVQDMAGVTKPLPGIGQPTPGAIDLQPQVTADGHSAVTMYNMLLTPVVFAISIFVLALLIWVMIRYRRGANPVPSKNSHNTLIEVLWTGVPILILALIFIPSFNLLRAQYAKVGSDAVTLKATGNQWFWSYKYPDNGDFEIVSNMMPDAKAVAAGLPRQLETDNRIFLPVNTPIKLLTASSDVIHSWAMPAFWIKLDAVPGRLNETSFTVQKEGVYYGQCSELCGARHGFMPIAVEVVSKEKFNQWVIAHGGHAKGVVPMAVPAATTAPAAPATTDNAAAAPAANAATPVPAKN